MFSSFCAGGFPSVPPGPASDFAHGGAVTNVKQSDLYALKCRLLLEGIAVDEMDLGPWKERTEHLYHHDGGTGPTFSYPQELVLARGADHSVDTVVNVRFNAGSPWRLAMDDLGCATLSGPGLTAHAVDLVQRPAYYRRSLSTGALASSVVQHLGLDGLGVVPNNYCSYFADGDQCRFCEIEPSYTSARSYPTMRKPTPLIVEAVNLAMSEPMAKYLIMTAGNLRSNDRTAHYYCDILAGLDDGRCGRPYRYGSIMPPESPDLIAKLHSSGLDGVGFNLEFFEAQQFARLAPGKEKYGRERLVEALVIATESFGVGHVYTNMIFGIQTWQEPGKPVDFVAESQLCLQATDELLAQGVIPLFTLYHSTNTNSIGPVQLDVDAAIDFHVEYARRVHAAKILPPGRTGVVFNIATIANHVCNDALAVVREERFAATVVNSHGTTERHLEEMNGEAV
jgi:hypothetical protein